MSSLSENIPSFLFKGNVSILFGYWLCVLFQTVIHIVAVSWRKRYLEIGNTALHKNVVPLQQLLDIAVVYTVTVIIGQYFSKVTVQLVSRSLL